MRASRFSWRHLTLVWQKRLLPIRCCCFGCCSRCRINSSVDDDVDIDNDAVVAGPAVVAIIVVLAMRAMVQIIKGQ